jgi:hypothetical protein
MIFAGIDLSVELSRVKVALFGPCV